MNTKKIFLFLILAFVFSWLIGGAVYLLDIDIKSITAVLMLIGYMFMPALAALLVQKVIYKEKMVKPLLISFKFNLFFLWALLIPLILVFMATGIGFLFPGISFTPDMTGIMDMYRDKMTPEQMDKMQQSIDALPFHPVWISIFQGLIAAATINAIAGFGEELGWRGFLLTELKNISFFKASLIIGIIWGLWHAPIILMGHNYPQHPKWGVLYMTIFCTLYTFLFNYITIKAKSVIASSLMHGSINAFFGITLMLSLGGTDLNTGITGLAGFICLTFAILLVFIYDRWISKEGVMRKTVGESLI